MLQALADNHLMHINVLQLLPSPAHGWKLHTGSFLPRWSKVAVDCCASYPGEITLLCLEGRYFQALQRISGTY